eukprot:scaffold1683_cov125-Isochrysis_galbana.AAC.2
MLILILRCALVERGVWGGCSYSCSGSVASACARARLTDEQQQQCSALTLPPTTPSPLCPFPSEKPCVVFSCVARAHRWVAPLTNSRPPMAARCEALPSTHLSGIQ